MQPAPYATTLCQGGRHELLFGRGHRCGKMSLPSPVSMRFKPGAQNALTDPRLGLRTPEFSTVPGTVRLQYSTGRNGNKKF